MICARCARRRAEQSAMPPAALSADFLDAIASVAASRAELLAILFIRPSFTVGKLACPASHALSCYHSRRGRRFRVAAIRRFYLLILYHSTFVATPLRLYTAVALRRAAGRLRHGAARHSRRRLREHRLISPRRSPGQHYLRALPRRFSAYLLCRRDSQVILFRRGIGALLSR